MINEITEAARKAAILNALKHDGKAQVQAVLGKLLAENTALKSRVSELMQIVKEIVNQINKIPKNQLLEIAKENYPSELLKEKIGEQKGLPPLPNHDAYQVIVTRFAPNPDFALHLGNVRAVILSHDYARMYEGRFILRFEDTDPRVKKAQIQYYDLIREDLRWLGCRWDEEYFQSDRLETYYAVAGDLIKKGAAYVCECRPEEFRAQVNAQLPCGDRNLDVTIQEERWEKMLNGHFKEGQAVLRVKTDLRDPNPAVRDWPAFRIIDTEKNPHPRIGSAYKVWPLYNMASSVDDHMMGVSHIIRGKEHLTNMTRQLFLYRHMDWSYPEAVHYGRLKVEGMNLSKSKLSAELAAGLYGGRIDDPRLPTLVAIRRRGFNPETLRKLVWEVGVNPSDITISWQNICAHNRKLIDPVAHRYYFTADPILVKITGAKKEYVANAPLHPDHPEMGYRTLRVEPLKGNLQVYLAKSDVISLKEGELIRLMALCNFKVKEASEMEVEGQITEEPLDRDVPIIQWVPVDGKVPVDVLMPDGTVKRGFAEKGLTNEATNALVQLVRFGFGRIDETSTDKVTVYYTHH